MKRAIALALFCVTRTAIAGTVANDHSALGTATISHAQNLFNITPASTNIVGTNLFYSLATLNLAQGEIANFDGPASMHNVITRITGGASSIDGGLACTILHANFLLIDANGVSFGPDSAVSVSGSFAVTTANVLKLADGKMLTAIPSASDTALSTAAPAAFGFLAAHPSPITINGTLGVPNRHAFSIVGGDLTSNNGLIQAGGGRITLAAVASPGTVSLDPTNPASPVALSGFSSRGSITLTNQALVTTSAAQGGQIVIRAGQLQLTNAVIAARTLGPGAGVGIDANVTGNLALTGGSLITNTHGTGKGGDLTITAGSITIDGQDPSAQSTGTGLLSRSTSPTDRGQSGNVSVNTGSFSATNNGGVSTDTDGPGAGGNITLAATDVSLSNSAFIESYSQSTNPGAGATGSINVNAQSLSVSDAAFIATNTFGTGLGGDINLSISGGVLLDGTLAPMSLTGIAAQTNLIGSSAGQGGAVHLAAGSLRLLDANIEANTFGTGNAGSVSVNVVGNVVINSNGAFGAGIGSQSEDTTTSGGGSAGAVSVTASNLSLRNGADITSSTLGDALGGSGGVIVNTQTLSVLNESQINTTISGRGAGGNVNVIVNGAATIDGTGSPGVFDGLAAESQGNNPGAGSAGSVHLQAAALNMLDGDISSDTTGPGAGGLVLVQIAGNAVVDGNGDGASGISAQSQSILGGAGGDVTLSAQSLTVRNSAIISTSTFGAGSAGNVTINAGSLSIVHQAALDSDTTGAGHGGNVDITVGSLTMRDGGIAANTTAIGQGGAITLNVTHSALIDGNGDATSGISAQSQSDSDGGDAGRVSINAADILLTNNAVLSTQTFGAGAAGAIHVQAQSMSIFNQATIDSSTTGAGVGGDIDLNIGGVLLLDGTSSPGAFTGLTAETASTHPDAGRGGAILLNVGSLRSLDGLISTKSDGIGNGGSISIAAVDVTFNGLGQGGSGVTVGSEFPLGVDGGASGNATISAQNLTLRNRAAISSDTLTTGAGGNINLAIGETFLADGTHAVGQFTGVAAETGYTGAGGGLGGSIAVQARHLQLRYANIDATAVGSGNGGTVAINVVGSAVLTGAGQTGSGIGSPTRATFAGAGNGGVVSFTAQSLTMRNGALIISSTAGAGDGRDVDVDISGPLLLEGNDGLAPRIAASSLSSQANAGKAGDVNVTAGSFLAMNGGLISATTTGPGQGGDATLTSPTITLEGMHNPTQTGLFAQTRDAQGGGKGGNVFVNGANLLVTDGAQVSAATLGSGDAGNVVVDSRAIRMTAGGLISAASAGTGRGGSVLIRSTSLSVDDADIQAAATNSGQAGSVLTTIAGPITLQNNANVAVSAKQANGGNIRLKSTNAEIQISGSTISAQAEQTGGNVRFHTPGAVLIDQSQIIAKSFLGNGGSIFIDPTIVVLDRSRLSAHAVHGNGGNVRIADSDGLLSFDTPINVSSTFGVSGAVQVQAPDQDVAGSIVALPAVLPGRGLSLEPTCNAQAGDASSFVTAGNGGAPLEPGGWLDFAPQR